MKLNRDDARKLNELINECSQLEYCFVLNLVSGMNQTNAYLEAQKAAQKGSSIPKKLSKETAGSNAVRALKYARVKALYEFLTEKAAVEAVMTKGEALAMLTKRAKCTIDDVIDYGLEDVVVLIDKAKPISEENTKIIKQTVWRFKDSSEMTPEAAAQVKEFKVGASGQHSLILYDSTDAQRELAKLLGWYEPEKIDFKDLTVTRRIVKVGQAEAAADEDEQVANSG